VEEEETSSRPTPWTAGILFGVLFGGLASAVSTVTIGRIWAACDIGVNANATSLTLLVLSPLIWIAAAVPWIVLYGTLGKHHPRAALLGGLLFTVWFTWFLVTWLGMVDDYPDPLCPGNIPPWWPSLIPT
jgi:hypothetical protein